MGKPAGGVGDMIEEWHRCQTAAYCKQTGAENSRKRRGWVISSRPPFGKRRQTQGAKHNAQRTGHHNEQHRGQVGKGCSCQHSQKIRNVARSTTSVLNSLSTAFRISTHTQARTPLKAFCTISRSAKLVSSPAITQIMTRQGNACPRVATIPPMIPASCGR